MQFENIRGILLDIEGTTSSISFVYDEMFPFVRRELDSFLTKSWDEESVQAACRQIVSDANEPMVELTRPSIQAEVIRLMDADVKATGLKSLQGLIWKSGFASGELVAHIYDDVEPALRTWKAAGIDLRIYSSGSVAAQKLFFGHTRSGNLLDLFTAHYDTTTGNKRESASYRTIAGEFGIPESELLFCSDIVEELSAADVAGWKTCLICRENSQAPSSEWNYEPTVSPIFCRSAKKRTNFSLQNSLQLKIWGNMAFKVMWTMREKISLGSIAASK